MAPFYQAGTYRCRGVGHAWDEAGTGSKQLLIKMKVEGERIESFDTSGEPQVVDAPVATSYERTVFLTINDKTIEYVIKKLRFAGFDGASFDDLDLFGHELTAICRHEPTQDGSGMRERWDLAWANESKALKSDSNVLRSINALYGKHLKASAPAASKVTPRPAAVAAVDDDPDGIPF